MCEEYLIKQHKNDIINILQDNESDKYYTININFLELFENNPNLGNNILNKPECSLTEWDKAVISVECKLKTDTNFTIKYKVHCRIYGLPMCPELHKVRFPENDDCDKFLQVTGTVIRMTVSKMLEYERQYMCAKCKYVMIVPAEYDKRNIIISPKRCSNPDNCNSTNIVTCGELNKDFCKDYQEIKIQENVSKLGVGTMPNSMWVTLEDDLIDTCKPGDNIRVCGIVKRRWGFFCPGKKIDIELVLKANHIQVNNTNGSMILITPDVKNMFEQFWETHSSSPLIARDTILKSFCPQIFGLHIVKLAMAVVLAGGSHVPCDTSTGVNVRSEPHLLLVGDPGTGKSQLLRFAAKIISRSVLTTGVGSTAAGLTVTAVKEDGEWQLEGGALVLADGGICCIDEFNSMKEHDRTSIHEAMEQQTISVAKASIVCKLSTKCSILAATNPKGNIDPSQPLNMNIALPSPLLSRFDLILLIRDVVNEEWDGRVVDYVLNGKNNLSKHTENIFWNIDTLQVLVKSTTDISIHVIMSRTYIKHKQLSQGHARLMFHKEVEIIDAVFAVVLVEISMEPDSSILQLKFDVHSLFPENPLHAYKELVQIVLSKLELNELLEKELENLNKQTSVISNNHENNYSKNRIIKYKTESKYFRLRVNQVNQENSNIEINNKDTNLSQKCSLRDFKCKRNNSNESCDKSNKKIKFDNENSSNILRDSANNFHLNELINNLNVNTLNEESTKIDQKKTVCINKNSRKLNNNKSDRTEKLNKNVKTLRNMSDYESKKSTNSISQEVLNDLQMLQNIPSVNDEFCFEDLLNYGSRQSTQISSENTKSSDVMEEDILDTSSLANNIDSESAECDTDSSLSTNNNTNSKRSNKADKDEPRKPITTFLNKFRFKKSEKSDIKESKSNIEMNNKEVEKRVWICESIFEDESNNINSINLDF